MTDMLISDIDGTLLQDGKIVVDFNMLQVYRESNLFVLCTGRNYETFSSFVKDNDFFDFDFAILSNGAMLIDKEFNVLYSSTIEIEVLKIQINQLTCIKGISRLFLVINLKEIMFGNVTDLLKFVDDTEQSDNLIGLTIQFITNAYAAEGVNQMQGKSSLSIQHNRNYLDIISNNTDKQSGIMMLLSNLEVKKFKVIGDGENDIPMFDTTEYSYTFYDAPESVKQKANFCVKSYNEVFEMESHLEGVVHD